MKQEKCKICRRLGVKLLLKGDRCASPKCAMIKKPYAPGPKKKRRFSALSEYGKELKEKQKLRNIYNLGEVQFRKYVREIIKSGGKVEDASAILVAKLESRFDNIIFRLGWAPSRSHAKQLVSHGHFLVNGKYVDIPSMILRKGDKITIRPSSEKRKAFQAFIPQLKKANPPSWLSASKDKFQAEVVGKPTPEETALPVEITSIFEFYSR